MWSGPATANGLCEDCGAHVTAKTKEPEKHYEGWGRNYAEAQKLAKQENKSMLVLFTGSDWCPPCKSLHQSVFTSSEFKSQVPENVVLVVCDNPRNKDLVTPEEQKQYQELAPKFKVSGVPSIFLTDADGKPYHTMVGYGGTPAATWVADLLAKVQENQ